MNLILHIGTPKTGTTTLQKWLYSNKNKLPEHGIFLSEVSGKVNNRRLVNFFKDDLNRPMRAVGPYDRDTLNYVPQQIQEHYKASNKQLSERFFSGKDVFPDAGHNDSPRRDTLFSSNEVSNILVKVYENLAPELTTRTQLSSFERDILQGLFKSFQKSSYLSSDDTFEVFRLAFKLHPSRNFQLNLEKHWEKQKQTSPIKRYWLSRLRRLIRR